MIKKDLQIAAEFFRGEPGFKRLFKKFIQNYRSLGRLGGTAKLTKLTLEEKEALGGVGVKCMGVVSDLVSKDR
jgi:hypothetical protein